jgi:hypothetical protein
MKRGIVLPDASLHYQIYSEKKLKILGPLLDPASLLIHSRHVISSEASDKLPSGSVDSDPLEWLSPRPM